MKYRLTDTAVRNAKPKPDGKPAKHTDGGGLYFWVTKEAKSWRYDYTRPVTGKRNTLVIGSYPEIPLKEARGRHQAARALLARGVDPSEYRKAQEAAQRALTEDSFEAVAREWHIKAALDLSSSHAQRNLRRLELHVFPYIGCRPIADIEAAEVLTLLKRIESAGTLETAHRVKYIISQVCCYAINAGKSKHDPTISLKRALRPYRENHHAAITDPAEVGALMRAIQRYKGRHEVRTAFRIAPYLWQRPGELRQMEWSELDMERRMWDIPAHKMKRRIAHLVPLPDQVIALIEDIRPLTGHRQYVFTSRDDPKKPISENTLPQALKYIGYDKKTMTVHGFRATARTIIDERHAVPEKYIEMQLSHVVKDPNGTAYNRAKFLPHRISMMQQWADYLDALMTGAKTKQIIINPNIYFEDDNSMNYWE